MGVCGDLCEAIVECDIDVVKRILGENPGVVNCRNITMTPLHTAVYECEDDYIANLILDIPGVDLTIQDIDGDTAFNLAVAQKKYDIVSRILGMNPGVLGILDKYGDSPIHVAYNDLRMLKILLECQGVDELLGVRGKSMDSNMEHRYGDEKIARLREKKCMTVMEMAYAVGNPEIVELLLNRVSKVS